MDSVSYGFSDNKIIRFLDDQNTRLIDTFDVRLQQKTFYFDGEVANSKTVDAIKMVTDSTFQNQELFIFKSNDAKALVNNIK